MSRHVITIISGSTRHVNRLIYGGISILNMSYRHDDITLTISSRDMTRATNILDDIGAVYSTESKSIMDIIHHICIARLGLIVGLVLSITFISIMSNMTLDVHIVGNILVPYERIEQCVNTNGYGVGHVKYNSLHALEDKLLDIDDSISYASCAYKGTTLEINIKEALRDTEIKAYNEGNIIANTDGIVTRIMVSSGTSRVSIGDVVRRGDILIEPRRIYGEGEETSQRETYALGEVYAKCYMREDIVLDSSYEYLVDTGRRKTVTTFSHRLPRNPYEYCDTYVERHRLFGLVPIEYTRYTFVEKTLQKYDINDENYIALRINNAYKKLDERLFEGEKVLNKWFCEKRLDNSRIISVYYEVEKLISGGNRE